MIKCAFVQGVPPDGIIISVISLAQARGLPSNLRASAWVSNKRAHYSKKYGNPTIDSKKKKKNRSYLIGEESHLVYMYRTMTIYANAWTATVY